jgi:hypothetical protein
MFGLLTAALLSVGAASPEMPAETLLAINPNISVGVCSGGDPIAASPTMSERVFSGRLHGGMSSEEVFGAQCAGYYQAEAQFCVSIPAPGGYYNIELTDAEGVDTTMALTAPSLSWPLCDDDGGTRGHALLSRVNGWLDVGDYLLFVGSYSQGESAAFILSVTSHDGTVW